MLGARRKERWVAGVSPPSPPLAPNHHPLFERSFMGGGRQRPNRATAATEAKGEERGRRRTHNSTQILLPPLLAEETPFFCPDQFILPCAVDEGGGGGAIPRGVGFQSCGKEDRKRDGMIWVQEEDTVSNRGAQLPVGWSSVVNERFAEFKSRWCLLAIPKKVWNFFSAKTGINILWQSLATFAPLSLFLPSSSSLWNSASSSSSSLFPPFLVKS